MSRSISNTFLSKSKEVQQSVKDDVVLLRNSLSRLEFMRVANRLIAKWNQNGLTEFATYFERQWVTGEFSNWCIYNTRAGVAGTNNSMESFNGILKSIYTHRQRLLLPVLTELLLDRVSF